MTPQSQSNVTVRELREAEERDPSSIAALVDRCHPADFAEWLQEVEDERLREIVEPLDVEHRSELLTHASDGLSERIVALFEVPDLVELAEELPPDEAVDMLALTEEPVSERVLENIDSARAEGLRELAEFDEETAGGIMTTDFDAFPDAMRVGDVIKTLRKDEDAPEDEGYGVYVIDADLRPVGFVSDRELLTTPIHATLDSVMEHDIVTVSADTDQEEVAQVLTKYGVMSVPVVDAAGAMLGIVSADDAFEVLEREAKEDIHKLVGATAEEQTRLPVLRRVRQRLPLMGLTVIGGLATAKVLELALAGSPRSTNADILRYVPIVIGLAGNVGIQSSTILVRGLATGEVAREREVAVLSSEVTTGTLIGIMCGLVTAAVAMFIEADPALATSFGVAVGAAVAIAVSWAATLGCLVPIVCGRIGIDPAVVAGPFLITLSDLSGTTIFMAVAHLILAAGGGL